MNGSPDDEQSTNSRQRSQKRRRQWSLEDRAKHRVLERERREAFNDRLMELGALLPSLEGVPESRLSKHVIVEESVKHHREQQRKLDESAKHCEMLQRERDQLLAEARSWRQQLSGVLMVQPSATTGATDPVVLPHALPNPMHGNAPSFHPGVATHDLGFAMPHMGSSTAVAGRTSMPTLQPDNLGLPLGDLYAGNDMHEWNTDAMAWPAYIPADPVIPYMDWLKPTIAPTDGYGHHGNGLEHDRPPEAGNGLAHWNSEPLSTSFAIA